MTEMEGGVASTMGWAVVERRAGYGNTANAQRGSGLDDDIQSSARFDDPSSVYTRLLAATSVRAAASVQPSGRSTDGRALSGRRDDGRRAAHGSQCTASGRSAPSERRGAGSAV